MYKLWDDCFSIISNSIQENRTNWQFLVQTTAYISNWFRNLYVIRRHIWIILYQYLTVRVSYNKGHEAFLQANCSDAITQFNQAISRSNYVSTRGYVELAIKEKAACIPFQDGIVKEHAGSLDKALVVYTDYITGDYPDFLSKLLEPISIIFLINPIRLHLLVMNNADKLIPLLNTTLFIERDERLPQYYFKCGALYENLGEYKYSFNSLLSLIREYPDHSLSREAEDILSNNFYSCEQISSLKHSELIK